MSSSSPHWLFSEHVLLTHSDGSMHVAPAAIQVQGAHITRVEQEMAAIERVRTEQSSSWREVGSKLIAPAFVNAHTHAAMVCFRGLDVEVATRGNVVEDLFFSVEHAMLPEDIAAFARMGAYECLLSGTALIWDHYYAGLALADAIASTGLCAVVAPTLQDLAGPGAHTWEAQLEHTLTLHQDERWQARGIWPALGPHASDTVSAELWERVRLLAHTHSLPIHAHISQSIEEQERAAERHGTSPIGWLERLGVLSQESAPSILLVHAIFASVSDLERLNPQRHALGFCPFAQLVFGFPADVTRWEEAGIPWALATDAAASNDSMNLQKEMRYVAGLRTGAATSHPLYQGFLGGAQLGLAQDAERYRRRAHARYSPMAHEHALLSRVMTTPGALHPGVRAGIIAPGALANLAIWDLEHPSFWPGLSPLRTLAMGDTTGALFNLMSRGVWLGEDGDYHRSITQSPEYTHARLEASERLQALLERL